MESLQKPVLQIAAKAAIVSSSGKILIVREAATGKNNTIIGSWTLVGGRINAGETFEDGLKREIMEEVGLRVEIERPIRIGEWHPVIHGVHHQIVAIFMLCRSNEEDVRLSTEHDKYAWINPGKRTDFSMIDPDCFVVDEVAKLGHY